MVASPRAEEGYSAAGEPDTSGRVHRAHRGARQTGAGSSRRESSCGESLQQSQREQSRKLRMPVQLHFRSRRVDDRVPGGRDEDTVVVL